MRVGIVAGEKSGDYLGAQLIEAILAKYPDAEFVGLAGPQMIAAGAVSLAEMDKISIMGITAALKGLPQILSIRKTIKRHMLDWKPDVFVGIDVPDFNLGLEKNLKQAGIPTVHYVSPTVWAWRSKRIVKIRKAIDLMLTLFPFEKEFYEKHRTRVAYVGHPLAHEVVNWRLSENVRSLMQDELSPNKRMIAILPGSRTSEVTRLAPVMLKAAKIMKENDHSLSFVIPAANKKLEKILAEMIHEHQVPVKLLSGFSRDVLGSCYAAVLASGTAALEAALFAKPMVVMYKVAKLEEWYASRTMLVKHFSMPNHLTDPPVVPELIQEEATVDSLLNELGSLLTDRAQYSIQKRALAEIAPKLLEDSGKLALEAIECLIGGAESAQDRDVC